MIIHFRMPGFEVQSERMLDSSLRGRPLAIISSHQQNGTVVALSEEAEEEGLSHGISVNTARKMSARTLFLPYNKTLYDRVNRYVNRYINRYSPVVEPEDLGRYYLDMEGMGRQYSGLKQAAFRMRKELKSAVDIQGRAALSSSKLVSSIATAAAGEEICEIEEGREIEFLDPLPVGLLPSASEKSLKALLYFLMLKDISELRLLTEDPQQAAALFSLHWRALQRESRGIDDRRVMVPREQPRILNQLVLNSDSNDRDQLLAAVRRLSEQTAYELRRKGQSARSFSVELHYNDGFRKQRRGKLSYNDDAHVSAEAIRLFDLANERRNRIRSILTEASDLRAVSDQLDMFDVREDRARRISEAADRLRDKYGFESILSGAGMYRTESNPLPARKRVSEGHNSFLYPKEKKQMLRPGPPFVTRAHPA